MYFFLSPEKYLSFYDGNWKDGAFWGEGTLYKEDGSIKSGEWNNGTLIQTLVDKNLPEEIGRASCRERV